MANNNNLNEVWTNQNTNEEHATIEKRNKTSTSQDTTDFGVSRYRLKSTLFALKLAATRCTTQSQKSINQDPCFSSTWLLKLI